MGVIDKEELHDRVLLKLRTVCKKRSIDVPQVLDEFGQLHGKRGRFVNLQENIGSFKSAYDWWTTMQPYREITKIARIALSLTASVAAFDRIFSLHGRVHNTTRNRLQHETVNKCVYVANMLASSSSKASCDSEAAEVSIQALCFPSELKPAVNLMADALEAGDVKAAEVVDADSEVVDTDLELDDADVSFEDLPSPLL